MEYEIISEHISNKDKLINIINSDGSRIPVFVYTRQNITTALGYKNGERIDVEINHNSTQYPNKILFNRDFPSHDQMIESLAIESWMIEFENVKIND